MLRQGVEILSYIPFLPHAHTAELNGNCFYMQLKRLKDENLSPLLPLDINLTDPSLSGLERTLSQLDMV